MCSKLFYLKNIIYFGTYVANNEKFMKSACQEALELSCYYYIYQC